MSSARTDLGIEHDPYVEYFATWANGPTYVTLVIADEDRLRRQIRRLNLELRDVPHRSDNTSGE
jgi:hypothetical protein